MNNLCYRGIYVKAQIKIFMLFNADIGTKKKKKKKFSM